MPKGGTIPYPPGKEPGPVKKKPVKKKKGRK